jgi:hypothetical protein
VLDLLWREFGNLTFQNALQKIRRLPCGDRGFQILDFSQHSGLRLPFFHLWLGDRPKDDRCASESAQQSKTKVEAGRPVHEARTDDSEFIVYSAHS